MHPLLRLEKTGHTAILTIQNPPANTWNRDSLIALKQTVQALNAERDIYALVITGEGEKFFSAGADLKLFADGDKAVARDMARVFGEAFETLSQFRGVSIAAINGYAMGGGLECALACDLRIAEEQAQMALQQMEQAQMQEEVPQEMMPEMPMEMMPQEVPQEDPEYVQQIMQQFGVDQPTALAMIEAEKQGYHPEEIIEALRRQGVANV